jgi:DNA-binding transcriptional regulator YhcF (GntR family)
MFLAIDERDPRPAYLQIATAIKQQVRDGLLAPGAELPSVRELAHDLGINLHTVRHAYQVLSQQGVVQLRLGRRVKIAPPRVEPAGAESAARLRQQIEELATEAFHLGVSPQQLRAMLEESLQRQENKEPLA